MSSVSCSDRTFSVLVTIGFHQHKFRASTVTDCNHAIPSLFVQALRAKHTLAVSQAWLRSRINRSDAGSAPVRSGCHFITSFQ